MTPPKHLKLLGTQPSSATLTQTQTNTHTTVPLPLSGKNNGNGSGIRNGNGAIGNGYDIDSDRGILRARIGKWQSNKFQQQTEQQTHPFCMLNYNFHDKLTQPCVYFKLGHSHLFLSDIRFRNTFTLGRNEYFECLYTNKWE